MIELKTAVFLAASLQMGAIVGGAGEHDQQHLYSFGKNLGLAFQVQDDWLDSFGNPSTFGKQPGGDIMANKKTFLLVHSLEKASPAQRQLIQSLMQNGSPNSFSIPGSSPVPNSSSMQVSSPVPNSSSLQNSLSKQSTSSVESSSSLQSGSSVESSSSSRKLPEKVERMLDVFRATGVDRAAQEAKKNYMEKAYFHLRSIRKPDENKKALMELAEYLLEREI
jgi:geranylgeranyl pyrophosphate synthase